MIASKKMVDQSDIIDVIEYRFENDRIFGGDTDYSDFIDMYQPVSGDTAERLVIEKNHKMVNGIVLKPQVCRHDENIMYSISDGDIIIAKHSRWKSKYAILYVPSHYKEIL